MNVLVVYYSMYGHIHQMAQAVAEGIREIEGAEAVLRMVPETLPDDVLEKMGALEFKKKVTDGQICTVDELASADAIIFGTPTRFGNMCGQMRQFLDATGQLWQKGALVGKVGSVFASSATQHGGQESTILSFHITLLHHGMIVVGLPYAFAGQMGVDRNQGRNALRRFHDCRGRRRTDAFFDRTGRSKISGKTCRRHRPQTDLTRLPPYRS